MLEDDAALEAVAAEACARAVEAPAWAAALAAALKDLKEVRSKVADLFKANPWLEKSLAETAIDLGTAEERIQALAAERSEIELKRRFEGYEDAVERAERFRVEGASERLSRINEHTCELFAKELLKTYRKQVETGGVNPGEEPPLYRAFPYRIEAMVLSNKVVVITVRNSPQGAGFAVLPSDFARARALIQDPAGAFVIALDNDARLEAAEARFLGEQFAAADIEDSKQMGRVRASAAGLAKAEKEVASAGKINPWLEGQTMKIVEVLARARKGLDQLVASVDSMREKGALLRSEVQRAQLEVAPHSGRAVLAPPEGGLAPVPKGSKGAAKGAAAAAVSAGASAAGATKAQAPTVVNVPESPEHVFQEVDYYNFPQSSAVRSAEAAAAAPVVDLAPPAPGPSGGVDNEVRAKVYDLEMRLNDYERRLFYMDKYTEMIQKQQLDKMKLMRELITVEGKRNRSRAWGVSIAALTLAFLALIAVWPDTVAAISAFLRGLGL